MPRWYPVSISGYHIGEAGSTPVQQAAYTLSNGFAYAEMLATRGVPVDQFAPRLSFFLDCGLDVEYIALSRVSRKIWAIGMRDVFGASPRGQMFKLHTQTSGRSLIAAEFKNNLTRTAAELMLAYMNGTNSCHSNSADEPFTTPSEEWIRLAAHGQAILLEESGIFKHTMNMLSGSPGMKAVERAVEKAILDEFREIESLGGVMGAVENRYQRSQIQNAAHRYEQQIYDGTRPIVGLTRYRDPNEEPPEIELARTPRTKQQLQVNRLKKFKKKNAGKAEKALEKLADVVESGAEHFPGFARSGGSLLVRPNHRLPAGTRRSFPADGVARDNVGGALESPASPSAALRVPRLVAACQTPIPRTCVFTGCRDVSSTFFVTKSLRPKKPVVGSDLRKVVVDAFAFAVQRERISLMHAFMSHVGARTSAHLTKHETGWQDGYYETLLKTARQFTYVAIYIEDNPAKKGLVKTPEEWNESSARGKT